MALKMLRQSWLLPIVTLLLCIQYTTAQGTSSDSGSSSSSLPPGAADSYTPSSGNSSSGGSGIVNYYFVFLALILAVAGLGAFLIWRRRRRALLMMRAGREDALERDVAGWQGGESRSRWYRQGRWDRSQENVDREEGLNELGEAPPAYAPRTNEERAAMGDNGQLLAVPMQSLSREHAGLKPPDYTEANVRTVEDPGRRSEGSAASRPQQEETPTVAGATNDHSNGHGVTGSNFAA